MKTEPAPLSSVQAKLPKRPLHLEDATTTTTTTQAVAPTMMQDIIAGGLAGSAGIVVGHPFDTIKVRMQMHSKQLLGGNLFRGMGAPVATAAFVNASIFSSYGYTCRLYEDHFGQDSVWKNVVGGAVSGVVSSFWLCPTEHVKVRLQLCKQGIYRNTLDATVQITKSHGLVGLYRGLAATVVRQVPSFSVYFGVYDPIKEQCNRRLKQEWFASIVAGGTAGSMAWTAVYPIDLIKSRIQSLPLDASHSEQSMWKVGKSVVQEGGWRALYRGLGITIFRAFPVNGIIFCVYEFSLIKLLGSDKFVSDDHMTPEMI